MNILLLVHFPASLLIERCFVGRVSGHTLPSQVPRFPLTSLKSFISRHTFVIHKQSLFMPFLYTHQWNIWWSFIYWGDLVVQFFLQFTDNGSTNLSTGRQSSISIQYSTFSFSTFTMCFFLVVLFFAVLCISHACVCFWACSLLFRFVCVPASLPLSPPSLPTSLALVDLNLWPLFWSFPDCFPFHVPSWASLFFVLLLYLFPIFPSCPIHPEFPFTLYLPSRLWLFKRQQGKAEQGRAGQGNSG